VIATGRAGEGSASGQLVEGAFDAARITDVPLAIADLHDVGQASIVIREAFEKLPNRELAEFFSLRIL
jgi:hypothetical protein